MAKKDPNRFRRRDKVVATVDLPGVPAGTPGKVVLVNGITWIRYRLFFENGVEMGSLDHRHLARRSEWETSQLEQTAS